MTLKKFLTTLAKSRSWFHSSNQTDDFCEPALDLSEWVFRLVDRSKLITMLKIIDSSSNKSRDQIASMMFLNSCSKNARSTMIEFNEKNVSLTIWSQWQCEVWKSTIQMKPTAKATTIMTANSKDNENVVDKINKNWESEQRNETPNLNWKTHCYWENWNDVFKTDTDFLINNQQMHASSNACDKYERILTWSKRKS